MTEEETIMARIEVKKATLEAMYLGRWLSFYPRTDSAPRSNHPTDLARHRFQQFLRDTNSRWRQ